MADDKEKKEEKMPPLNETLPADVESEIKEWSLPDELTKLILVRLRAIELIGCKFVSKLWLSLISSPDFISDHINRSKSDPSNHLLLFHYDYPLSHFCRPPDPIRSIVFFICPQVTLIGSANGLICIARSIHPKMTTSDIWIMNPVTQHILKLPRPTESPTDNCNLSDGYGVGHAYFVFWWDSVTDEYKVAKILPKNDDSNTTAASVWVSGSPETWSDIHVGFDGAFHHPAKFVSGCDIVVGNFAYWIVFKVMDRQHIRDVFVLSLDLKTLSLSLSKSPFPLHPDSPPYMTHLDMFSSAVSRFNYYMFAANWKEKFVLAERVGGLKRYDVWTMDIGEGWGKECSIDYPILNCITNVNGKAVVMIMVDTSKHGLALYDIGTGESEPIEDFISGHSLASAHDFVGSLVSIEGSKPLKAADELSQHIRVIWPDPSAASRMSGNSEIKIRGAEQTHT